MIGNLYPKNNKSIEVYRGDTLQIVFENVPELTTPSIVTVQFQVRLAPDQTLLINKDVLISDPANDWANGRVAVNLTSGQTQGLKPDTLYRYDLRISRDGIINADYFGNFYLVGDISGTDTIVDPVSVGDIYTNLSSSTTGKGASLIGVLSSFWTSIVGTLTVESVLQWLYNNTLKKINPFTGNKLLRSDSTDQNIVVETGIAVSGNNLSNVSSIDINGQYLKNGVPINTDDIPEGSNLYYTQARFDSAFSAKSTTDLSEGSNLYFSNLRVLDYLKVILSSAGDILYRDNSNNIARLPVGTNGQVLQSNGTLPVWSSASLAGSLPIGTIIAYDEFGTLSPPFGSEWMGCNGQLCTDTGSPYNGYRVPNLNGATITNIPVTAVNNTTKIVTVSVQNARAFSIGDTLSFNISIPNAVVKNVNFSTGEITIGDSTVWNALANFALTTHNLTGITTITALTGVKRYLKGGDGAGSNIDTFQGHRMSPLHPQYLFYGAGGTDNISTPISGTGFGTIITTGDPVNDPYNGTPRTGPRTEPPNYSVIYLIKIK
jgi:hypothetical protein